ncbi:MAG: hypothetical protein IT436_10910 [Phycisphaerales bacterium]|nr:hypothetical protein [Phycisphaerales bacterium]
MRVLLAAVVCLSAGLARAGDPQDPAIRREIELVLQDMAATVLAGDAEAYLGHVWTGDPNFVNEQKYWANDLRKKKPLEFEYSLAEDKFEVGDGRVAGDLTMTWRMEGDGDKPRSVSHAAQFILQDGRWRFAGEVWEHFDSDRCIVFFDPGFEEVAKTVAEVLPEVRAHVHQGFGFTDASPLAHRTQQIKLYPNMKHLQASITLSYRDGLGGWNEPGEAIKLLVNRRRDAAGLKNLLAHEYGHVATFELGPRSNHMPWWILEGVAELSAEHYAGSAGRADAAVRRWARDGKLADWLALSDFNNFDSSLMGHVYTQGHQFLGYVSERFGRAARLNWMARMSNGESLDQATSEVFGMSFATLDEQWRGSLMENPPEPPKKETAEAPKPDTAKEAKAAEPSSSAEQKAEPPKTESAPGGPSR